MPDSSPWDVSDDVPTNRTPLTPLAPDAALDHDDHGSFEAARPPLMWLVLALALSLAGGILAGGFGSTPVLAVAGWVLAGPLAIGAIAVFTLRDTKAQAALTYVYRSITRPAYWICLMVCLLAVAVAAVRIALWIGRLE